MRHLAFLVFLAAASACSLPSRDNDYDPARAPAIGVAFTDATVAGGACMTTAQLSSAQVTTLTISRGRCVGAIVSVLDPQNDAVSSVDIEMTGPVTLERSATVTSAEKAVAIFAPEELRAAGDRLVDVTVRVADVTGARAQMTVQMHVANDPPVVVRIPPRTIPFGGQPWAKNAPVPISFGGAAVADFNGDEAEQWAWRWSDGSTATSTNPNDPAFIREVPSAFAGVFAGEVRVSDDLEMSAPRRSVVRKRPANIWASSQAGIVRIDGALYFHRLFGSVDGPPTAYFPRTADGPKILVHWDTDPATTTHNLMLASWPDLSFVDVESIPDENWRFALSVDRGTLWGAYPGFAQDLFFTRFDLTDAGIAVGPQFTVDVPDPLGSYNNPVLQSADNGDIWAHTYGENVFVVASSGTLTATHGAPGHVLSVRRRPGTGEMWAVRGASPIDGAGPGATLHVYGATETTILLPDSHAYDLAFVDSDTVWISLGDRVILVDAAALTAGASLVEATAGELPVSAAFRMTPVRDTGDVWAFSFSSGALTRFNEDGIEVSVPLFELPTIDDAGMLWLSDFAGLRRVEAPIPSGLMARVPVGRPDLGSSDWEGGVWYASQGIISLTHRALVHAAEDGTVYAEHPEWVAQGGGLPEPLPFFNAFRTRPGTSLAYAIPYNDEFDMKGLYEIDLAQTPPAYRLVLDSNGAAGLRFPVFEPSAPIPASTPFFWTVDSPPIGRVVQMSLDGQTVTPRLGLTGIEGRRLRAARSLRTNTLCLGTWDENGNTLRFRSITPEGAVTTLATVALPDFTNIAGVAVSPDFAYLNDDELCWIAFQPPSPSPGTPCTFGTAELRAYRPGVTTGPNANITITDGRIHSIRPIDPDHVWVTVDRCEGPNEFRDLDYMVRTGFSFSRRATFRNDAEDFIDPEVSPRFGLVNP